MTNPTETKPGTKSPFLGPEAGVSPEVMIQALSQDRARFIAFVRRRTSDRDEAEDLLQIALTRALERAHTLQDLAALEGWFFQILRNVLTDHGRRLGSRQRKHERLFHEQATSTPAVERAVRTCACVGPLKDALKPEYGQALERIHMEGTPVKTFAEQEGITAGTAGVRVHRARQALRARVEQACGACASHGCQDCTCPPPEKMTKSVMV